MNTTITHKNKLPKIKFIRVIRKKNNKKPFAFCAASYNNNNNNNNNNIIKFNQIFGKRENINFRSWAVLRILYRKSCIDYTTYYQCLS